MKYKLTLLITLIISGNTLSYINAQSLYNYPTESTLVPLKAQVFSVLTREQSRLGVPEITIIQKKEEPIVFSGKNLELVSTQKHRLESPSRIIWHNGKYHSWIMHICAKNLGGTGITNVYITSNDGKNWNVEGLFPNGEKGSMDEGWREGIQVVKFDGKFWMFYAGSSTASKYNLNRYETLKLPQHGICLMVADRPEGPWKYAIDKPIINRSDNPNEWDYELITNPYPVYFKGKWFVYYKSFNFEKSGSKRTLNGVAYADNITGPYTKFEGNPVCDAHGSFAWVYRGGITMIAFGEGFGKIHWSPDGLHFKNVDDPKSRGIVSPYYSSLYIPYDPLCGDPVTNKEPDELWGLEPKINEGGKIQDAVWPLVKGTLVFNPVRKEIFTPELVAKIKSIPSELHPIYYREVFGSKKVEGAGLKKVIEARTKPTPYDYPTEAVRIPLIGEVFSDLTFEQARKGVPEIKLLSKKEENIEYIGAMKDSIDLRLWQESPSRIIFHDGKYHAWFMHLNNMAPKGIYGRAKNFYITSKDGYKWEVMGQLPAGEPGSFDDIWREGLQVVKFDGKFWMFYAGNTSDKSKIIRGDVNTYGIGLLVADSPAGPWKRAVEQPLFTRGLNETDWDFDQACNPYPVYFKGKWFVYYKGSNLKLNSTGRTWQGVAVADKITGPYSKSEGNPICDGHGSFVWAYRGGVTMLPFGYDLTEGRINWSPDGYRFHIVDYPLSRGVKTPIFSSFYLLNDPLCGDPLMTTEPNEIWGLETRQTEHTKPVDWKLFHGTIEFNTTKK